MSFAQGFSCFSGLRISLRGSDAESVAICQGDGETDVLRFTANLLVQPVGYVVVDESDIIVKSSYSNIIDLEGLPAGNLRVYGFYYFGSVNPTEGQKLDEAALATGCYNLSENFFPIYSITPDGQTVSTEDGLGTAYTCPGDGNPDVISFTTTSTDPFYTYIITDEENTILAIATDNSFDFDGAPAGNCRVWGVSHVGNVTVAVGENIETAVLAEECYDLSDNYIEVIRSVPDGGTVSLTDGTDNVVICTNVDSPDVLSFEFETGSQAPYAFVLTDADNLILQVIDGHSLSSENIPIGVSRIWGLSFTGTITAAPGDDAAAVDLTDDCYDLSDNFIEITKKDPDGGMVSLADGGTETVVCVGDGLADELSFVASGNDGDAYVFVITDENNNILLLSESGIIDFEGAVAGVFRVWGLAYSGNILANVGDNAAATVLTDECYDLSDNFVTVVTKATAGGTVSLSGGGTEAVACVGDGTADELSFSVSDHTGEAFVFVITDESNNILDLSVSGVVDFEGTAVGVYRVWGLAYSGNILATVGDNAATTALTDECYDLSGNFVTVTGKSTEGGTVSLADGSTEAFVCVGDGNPDVFTFIADGNDGESFIFVITDETNTIQTTSQNGVFDFENAGTGVSRVWGLAYSGNLTAAPGQNAAEIALSDECYDLSDNFVTIDRRGLNGGTVSLADGATEATVCLDEISPDNLNFIRQGASSQASFIFVITDENNVIVDVSTSAEINFSDDAAGVYRVWGLSYTGTITAGIGDNAAETELTDQCYDLSDNFVTVTVKAVDGAQISLEDGATETVVCSDDAASGILTFVNASTAGADYGYVITDTNNVVVIRLTGASINFNVADPGEYRVWGFSFTGEALIETGDDAAATVLSSECYDLSDNFIAIRKDDVEGGVISMPSGEAVRNVCPSDGVADVVTLSTTGSSTGSYVYVITDENNVILAMSENNSIDFDTVGTGVSRIWGLAYSGNLLAQAGDDAAAVALSDACYDLSGNFITIIRETPEGGTVSMPSGETVRYTCPGDNLADVILFDSTGTSNTPYGYIITDENNIILAFAEGDRFDFNDLPQGTIRVWGLAYTGNLTALPGDDAGAVALSDDCYDLSENFIEVRNEVPDGGTVAFVDGSESINLCEGAATVVQMITENATSGPYAFLLLEEQEQGAPMILSITESDSFDLTGLEEKTYLIRGLAYTGNLLIAAGDTLSASLSDDCFDLSANTLSVNNVQPDGGTVSAEGFDTSVIELCVGDGSPDSLTFIVNTPATAANSDLIITDGSGVFLEVLESEVFNFENVIGDTFLIYHVSYTGLISLGIGDQIDSVEIASGCAELSEPLVIVANSVDGGRLLTTNNTTLEYICAGDGVDDIITLFNTSSTPNASYKYVLTTEQGLILSTQDSEVFDVTNTRFKALQLWGVSYTGTFVPSIGSLISNAVFSADGCFVLSDNPVELFIDEPEGGIISAGGGATELSLCIGVDPNVVEFETTSDARVGYVYVLASENDRIIEVIDGSSVDFAELPVGLYHIWAVSYTGTLTATPQANFLDINLSTSCFERSANFIEVIRFPAVNGGQVLTTLGDETVYTCPGNGLPDIVSFFNTGSAPNDEYLYLITNENNEVIIPSFRDDVINFESAPPRIYRIHGISYHGTLLTQAGTDIFEEMLSDSCWELSENFITVVNLAPEGGTVSTADGLTEIEIIQGDGLADSIAFINAGASAQRYAYVATDEDNVIISLSTDGIFDFEVIGSQPTRVWGLSYTGNIIAMVGDDADEVAITDDCWDLSDNFVLVNVSIPGVEGARENRSVDTFVIDTDRIVAAPNPAFDYVNLRIELQTPARPESVIRIFNTSGQMVYQNRLAHTGGLHTLELNTSNWRSGIYAVQVQNGDKVVTERFVRQE